MSHYSIDDIARRDFLTCLGVWIALELVSFVIFPMLGLVESSSNLGAWFLASLPLGVGGSFLIGLSSRIMGTAIERVGKSKKPLLIFVSQVIGWVGLGGVSFPLFVASIEAFSKAFSTL